MNENQKRTIHYSFKATPEEDEIIQKKMELAGIKNQSAFIRRIVLGGLILRLDLPELKSATRLMGNLSNNVNQIARRLHEGGSIYETEVDDIVERQKQLQDTLDKILTSLDRIRRYHILSRRFAVCRSPLSYAEKQEELWRPQRF